MWLPQVALPVAGHGPVGGLRRAVADQELWGDERLAPTSYSRPRHSERPSRAQARAEVAPEPSALLDEERLVDGLVTDPHRRVIGEVESQAAGDLLRAPRSGPPSVLSAPVSSSLPGDLRPSGRLPGRSRNGSAQAVSDVVQQPRVGGQLRGPRPAGGPVGVPLRRGRTVNEAAAPRGGVTPELAGDRRGRPADPACDLAHAVALGTEEGDLLALGEGEVPPGRGHRRGSEVGRGHAAGLSEPSGPDRRGHADATRGVLAGEPFGDRDPEPSPVLLTRDRRAPRRTHGGSPRLV